MRAIILAAGIGRRLGLREPKSMADVAGESIIHRQIRALRAAGVEEFVFVVGYEQDLLQRHILEAVADPRFVVNTDFDCTNTMCSLYLARDYMTGLFWYANADVVFDWRLPRRLAQVADDQTALAMRPGLCTPEDVKMIVHDQRLSGIGKHYPETSAAGEFVGVARFGAALTRPFLAQIVNKVENQQMKDAYFEAAIDALCADHEILPVEVGDLPVREVDFPEDLQEVRTKMAQLLEPPPQ
jgi:choline kinase